MNQSKSEALFARALKRIPGGVNSPVRGFRGERSRLFGLDGN